MENACLPLLDVLNLVSILEANFSPPHIYITEEEKKIYNHKETSTLTALVLRQL